MQTTLSKKEILSLDSGVSCYYYKIPHQMIGVKLYKTKRERNYSLQMQSLAYLAGLAPKTGNKIDCDGFFGFETEHVLTLEKQFSSWKLVPKKFQNQLDNLVQAVYDCCEHEVDRHWKNFGIINDNLVCIDFGYSERMRNIL